MTTGNIRRVFPGNNTPQGFFSYYNYIIPPDACRIFVLKGGPGTGKSTFMKQIGQTMSEQGYDVEFHHCSSDNNSLDGVVIPALEIAFIDGTAPHIVDPKNPGCVDEILNLGSFWNETGLMARKQHIIDRNADIAENFARAYRLLAAAKAVYDDWESVNTRAMDFTAANRRAAELTAAILGDVRSIGCGKVRKLFASAITPDGALNYLETIIGALPRCYVITGDPGTGRSTLLQKVLDAAVAKGLNAEGFYCPLDPGKLEHLVLPALGVVVTTSAEPHAAGPVKAALTINMNEGLNGALVARHGETVDYDREMFWSLFHRAVAHIKRAKLAHDDLETSYIPNMDFGAIEQYRQQILDRVLAYH